MPSLRQRLESLRDEALDLFAHPEDRQRGNNTRRKLACVMAEMRSLIQGTPLLGPTAPTGHQYNTRRMASALSFRRYECWAEQITYDEDIFISKTPAGESESDVGSREAETIFLEAFSKTITLLDIAEPMKTDAGTGHASQSVEAGQGLAEETVSAKPASLPKSDRKGRKRGPKPDYETATLVAEIVAGLAPDGDWRSKVDEVGEALDHGVCNASDPKTCEASDHKKIPIPRGWKKKGNDWLNPPDRATMVKDIEYRLERAREKSIT